MRRAIATALTIALLFVFPRAGGAQTTAMWGFSPTSASNERALEGRLDASIRTPEMRRWLERLSARPHHLGSPYDRSNAEYLRGLFAGFGYDAHIERYDVLFSTPTKRTLELTAPTHVVASLAETPLAVDPTSGQTSEQLPLYNAYSIGGDVRAALVYVNYGVPQDYALLAQRGIDVRGKIVIARYGGSWRGIKPKVAAEHGALGCILYSDPRDDGYFQAESYPNGTGRNATSGQRGSVADIPTYPGDPSTPGVGSVPGVKRLPVGKITTLTKIPVLPISYTDALPLLRALRGPIAPAAWRGALPITYHLGDGSARVHLALAVDFHVVPAYDVIATMRGSERPDEWIMRGNHHDAWVNGASDPLSGAVCVLEEARVIADLARSGAKPRRTIVFALWDGEEPGLLGSTEFVETHEATLRQKAAVYINSDGNERGFLDAGASHSLERVVTEVASDVVDPERGGSVAARRIALKRVNAGADEKPKDAQFHVDPLGSGSDFSSFLQHAGIATMNIGYGGEEPDGSYHSIFDSFAEYTRFRDPNFAYEATLVKTTGRLVLRFANADVLPFAFTPLATTAGTYADEVKALVQTERTTAERINALLASGALRASSDPHVPFVAPTNAPAVPDISADFAPLTAAITRLTSSAAAYDAAIAALLQHDVDATLGTNLDRALMKSEASLLDPHGLPRRPWYRHQLYAPGFYTGYGVKTMPAIREAIEQHRWDEARAGITTVSAALNAYADTIDAAAFLVPKEAGGASRLR